MPAPSRDRLARPVDISTLFHGAARRVDLVVDEPGLIWSGLSGNQNPNVPSNIGGRGSPLGRRRVSGYVRSRNLHRSGLVGRENRMVGRRSSGRGRVLPSWYPRTPLRDITAIVRAIERRRAEIHGDDQVADAPHQEETNALPSPSNAAAQLLEQEVGESTPMPTIAMKPQPSPSTDQASKIVEDSSNLVTPQQKLLNSIDQVREIWLQEQRKLEKTPAAKKAEREKKMRTLMSMR